jgi:Uma2 family endonuclease
MSPSRTHDRWKKTAARLIELYVWLLDLPINGYGSTTFRKKARDRGLEPDECWSIRRIMPEGDVPDIVLEVIYSKPEIDKLKVYDGLRVPEVWFFERGAFVLHRRKPKGGYRMIERSTFLPQLDFGLLSTLVVWEDQHAALKELAKRVRG